MIDTCHCSFVQTIGRKTPRVNCNVNYELQVIVMSPCRFIKWTNTPFWWGMLIVREAMHVWASLVAQIVKRLPAMWETWVQSLDREGPLEKEIAIHSSTLAGKFHGRRCPVGKSRTRLSDFTSCACEVRECKGDLCTTPQFWCEP